MKTYAVLYNPLAGNGRGKEASLALRTHLTDGEITFTDMTGITDYAAYFASLSPMAFARSARRSSACSIPTDRRIRPSVIPTCCLIS